MHISLTVYAWNFFPLSITTPQLASKVTYICQKHCKLLINVIKKSATPLLISYSHFDPSEVLNNTMFKPHNFKIPYNVSPEPANCHFSLLNDRMCFMRSAFKDWYLRGAEKRRFAASRLLVGLREENNIYFF